MPKFPTRVIGVAGSRSDSSIETLHRAFDNFYQTLQATTIPTARRDRKVGGIAHAVALSEATILLHDELVAMQHKLTREFETRQEILPVGMTLMHSDSPDGPWTAVPQDAVRVSTVQIGGKGANPVLMAALESAVTATAFSTEKWNAMQAAHPGAIHHRWRPEETITGSMLDALECAQKLLQLRHAHHGDNGSLETQIRRLSESFRQFGESAKVAVEISRSQDSNEVELTVEPQFLVLASRAGNLLNELPEHWLFGIQATTKGEIDPGKRWLLALFDLAFSGTIDVANWDEKNSSECIKDAAKVSVLACDALLRFKDRPNWGKGNFRSAIELARVIADEVLQSTKGSPRPDLSALYGFTCKALSAACDVAKMSRKKDFLSPPQFVETQTLLEECFTRAEKLAKNSTMLKDWPTTPGVTFSWMGDGDSALAASLGFARAILSATLFARTQTVGIIGHNPPALAVADPAPDPKITSWREATIKELCERTLQPQWPIWEIERDYRRIGSLLRDEHRRAFTEDTRPHRGRSVDPAYLDALAIISKVPPTAVKGVSLPLSIPELEVRSLFEQLIGEPFHAKDSGVECCDMFTCQGLVQGRQCTVAAMFKGSGKTSLKWPLQVAGCGARGDQIVRLFDVPADLYLIQANGSFDATLLKHIQNEADAHSARGARSIPYMLIDGATTARIVQAARQ